MAKTILVTSGKGGVGKSLISAMLAVKLSLMGNRVVVFDYDTGLRNLDIILGMQGSIVYNVIDYINKEIDINQALIQHNEFKNLWLLPAAQYAKQKDIEGKHLKKIIESLENECEYIIIDCPAGIEKSVKNAIKRVEMSIVVATADNVSIRDAEKIVFEINKNGITNPQLIVNRIQTKLVKKGQMFSPKTVSQTIDIPLLGYIEEDIEVTASLNIKGLPPLNSKAFCAADRIAKRISGIKVEIKDLNNSGFLSFFNRGINKWHF